MDISVIVPVHNSEIYLEACLKTLHEQTHQAAEFIVIDDGSDDKSGAICDAFSPRSTKGLSSYIRNQPEP